MRYQRTSLAPLVAIVLAVVSGATAVAAETELGIIAGVGVPDDRVIDEQGRDLEAAFGLRGELFLSQKCGWFIDGIMSEFSVDNAEDVEWLTGRTGFNWYVTRHTNPAPLFFSLGGGVIDADRGSLGDYDGAMVSVGLGQRVRLNERHRMRWELRWDRTGDFDDEGPATDVTMFYALASWNWGFGVDKKDTDGDGVFDSRDKCPDTPHGATVDEKGCPKDTDGDGVYDGLDKCPDTQKGWPVDASGCPTDSDGDGVPDGMDKCPNTQRGATVDATGCPKDSDGDGVYDGIDKCPDTPKGASVDAAGCPKDSDGDGVPDGTDKCPDTPRGATVDATGCPKDSDGDGVYDGIDKCANTPKGAKVDATGCPTAAPLFQPDRPTLVLEGVFFEFDKATLTENSKTVLNGVAESLLAWPEVKVEVAGHTDSKGSDAYNQKLSQERAQSVRDYLVSKGVPSATLTARGYGEAKPIASNDTDAGRAKNRRVELTRQN